MAFLARIAIQLDLAQFYGLIAVPAGVSFIVWRDGYYSLQGSGILVQACDLPWIWLRFSVYLAVKPFSTYVWRKMLQRRMALALLGLDSDMGKSEFAVDVGGGNLLQDDDKEARDAKVHERAGVTEEQLELVREELSISNLNYEKLYTKLVRRSWLFFTCVALWQMPAALYRHRTAPRDVTDSSGAASNYTLPISASWLYVPVTTALQTDTDLGAAFDQRLRDNSSCVNDLRYGGWAGDFGWEQRATDAWQSFTR
eukprot:5420216-Prymnesium_polylepis.1